MEAMTDIHGVQKWTWANITLDLITQGGLSRDDILINPASFAKDHFFAGKYKDDAFTATWVKDTFLLVSMTNYAQELVDAFSAIVGYKPFARYSRDGYTTVEWDAVNPAGRWQTLCDSSELELEALAELEK